MQYGSPQLTLARASRQTLEVVRRKFLGTYDMVYNCVGNVCEAYAVGCHTRKEVVLLAARERLAGASERRLEASVFEQHLAAERHIAAGRYSPLRERAYAATEIYGVGYRALRER